MNAAMHRGESDADFCRRMGYGPGTRLAGDESYGVTVIQITAVGERLILAKLLSHRGYPDKRDGETILTLEFRDWKAL